jgi:hypothetical protein
LLVATEQLLERLASVPEPVARRIASRIWVATKFLTGSASRDIPYEIVYGLKLALDDWKPTSVRRLAITTALLDDSNFYFQRIDVDAYMLIDAYLKVKFDEDLIQIALPRLYRHTPLKAVPLYHELGHFLDVHNQVTEYSLLRFPPDKNPTIPPMFGPGTASLPDKARLNIHKSHRQEMFADLFAASYAGLAYEAALNDIGPGHKPSPTHPGTADRLALSQLFLAKKSHPVIDMFNTVLAERGLPILQVRFSAPDIVGTFGNMRPYNICADSEIHGILSSALAFERSLATSRPDAWRGLSVDEVSRITNDLVERSIRNRMFMKAWTSGAS